MAEVQDDSVRKQLYTLLHRSARIFANGYANAYLDLDKTIGEQELAFAIMVHIDRVMQSLADQFGIEWTDSHRQTLAMTVREVCINKYKPF